MMPDTDIAIAQVVAERIRRTIAAEPFAIHKGARQLDVTISIGLAARLDQADTPRPSSSGPTRRFIAQNAMAATVWLPTPPETLRPSTIYFYSIREVPDLAALRPLIPARVGVACRPTESLAVAKCGDSCADSRWVALRNAQVRRISWVRGVWPTGSCARGLLAHAARSASFALMRNSAAGSVARGSRARDIRFSINGPSAMLCPVSAGDQPEAALRPPRNPPEDGPYPGRRRPRCPASRSGPARRRLPAATWPPRSC